MEYKIPKTTLRAFVDLLKSLERNLANLEVLLSSKLQEISYSFLGASKDQDTSEYQENYELFSKRIKGTRELEDSIEGLIYNLSSEDISNIYYELKLKYTGKDCIIDENTRYEWSYIPHFYTPFYVYKYATGVSAAIIIATNILSKKEGYVEKYINMLKQGCTKKAVELLKMVDVDLEDINTYKGAIDFYRELTEELKELI